MFWGAAYSLTGTSTRSARVSFDQDSLGSSFSVCVFVTPPTVTGDPFIGKNPLDWVRSKYYAGEVVAFTSASALPVGPGEGSYGAFKIIQGFVSLNAKLKEFIDSVEPKDVEKHLHSHLLWKVGKVRRRYIIRPCFRWLNAFKKGAKEVDLSKVPTLEVTVFSSKLKGLRDDVPFPEYEDAIAHPDITEGKRGGSKSL